MECVGCHPLEQQYAAFLAPVTSFMETHFSMDWGWGSGDGLRMIQMHFISCALYFYYYISSTSDGVALGPLLFSIYYWKISVC